MIESRFAAIYIRESTVVAGDIFQVPSPNENGKIAECGLEGQRRPDIRRSRRSVGWEIRAVRHMARIRMKENRAPINGLDRAQHAGDQLGVLLAVSRIGAAPFVILKVLLGCLFRKQFCRPLALILIGVPVGSDARPVQNRNQIGAKRLVVVCQLIAEGVIADRQFDEAGTELCASAG
jgi:hypothetical protein